MESFTIPCKFSKVIHRKSLKLYDFFMKEVGEARWGREVRVTHSQFKCNYLKNKTLYFSFWFHFWNLHQVLNILKKEVIVIANVFLKLQTVKDLVRPLSKRRRFTNMLKHPKYLWNLHESAFIMFFHHSEENWFGNTKISSHTKILTFQTKVRILVWTFNDQNSHWS